MDVDVVVVIVVDTRIELVKLVEVGMLKELELELELELEVELDVGRQLQALETRETTCPLQASTAYFGIPVVAVTVDAVNVAQND